jgi:hypothetical protein
MCERGDTVLIETPGGNLEIDRCIAALVGALNDGGLPTTGSCCGHGSGMGDIFLHDGRILVVLPSREAYTAVRAAALEKGRLKPLQY